MSNMTTKKETRPVHIRALNDDIAKATADLDALTIKAAGLNATGDLSNSQYGALGMWALADAGYEVPTSYCGTTDRLWRTLQLPSGEWGYWFNPDHHDDNPRDTMTLAGIATLFVTNEFLDTEVRLLPKLNKNIDLGLKSLNATFQPSNELYYMYGVERVGLASGLKFFNQTNWYQEGALFLLQHQKDDGSWEYQGSRIVGTSYALLFLARGRNAVVFNKLEYDGPWNARPRDNANITGWMSKKFERPINWQSVNLKVDPDEWLDAPVLLITGSRDPNFADADLAKLQRFIHAGGIIFSTSDGGSPAFTAAIKKIGSQLVGNQYESRDLPPDHPVFNLWSPVAVRPRMLGLSNGARELWIHAATDIGAPGSAAPSPRNRTSRFPPTSSSMPPARDPSAPSSSPSPSFPRPLPQSAPSPSHACNAAPTGTRNPAPGRASPNWPRPTSTPTSASPSPRRPPSTPRPPPSPTSPAPPASPCPNPTSPP